MTDRPTFQEKTFSMLQAAIHALAAEVPEIEGVGLVVLWRLPDQASVPSVLVQGTGGPLVSPDQFLRLHLATLRLEQYCIEASARGTHALREMASELAREARRTHEQRSTAAAQGSQGTQAHEDGGADQHPA